MFLSLGMYGQSRLINPTPTFLELEGEVPVFKCDTFDIDQRVEMLKNDLLNGINPLIFAKKFAVSLTPENSGIWEEQEGLMVWRLRIESEKAYSMMLIIDELNLPPFSSLFLYNQDMSYIAGPYTELYAQNTVLPTPLIPGSIMTVELAYEKDSVESPPSFVISSISHDYANMFGYLNQTSDDGYAGSILDCHNDINCPVGDPWQIEKGAVARIVIDGNELCTGALVNNTLLDGTPYFLTADHCIDNNSDAERSVFYFNYESPVCNGGDGQTNLIVSGARRRSFNANSDFSLLQLNARVPSSYQPFFAGWDRSGANPNSAVVIHHPVGNVKKISFDNDPIAPNLVEIILGNVNLQPNTAWDVDLDNGTTEGGSSGAPLFNNNGRIIGQNSGGIRGCPGENGVLKHYGRLSVSWDTGANNTERLRDWLDPENNAPNVIRGYAPQGWIHAWMNDWDAPAYENVHPSLKALDVGYGVQVFYRGDDNQMHTFYWGNDDWNHAWVTGPNDPEVAKVGGDMVVGEGNQIFYRGQDGRMQTYYWWDNDWHHAHIGNGSPSEMVSSSCGSLAVGDGNQLFYRGTDDQIHTYYWANNSWHHAYITGPNDPEVAKVGGDVVVGEGNQLFYRGQDGRMQTYYWWDNDWHHAHIGNDSNEKVSPACGSIHFGLDKVFYRGTDNLIHVFFWNEASWEHGWLTSWEGNYGVEKVSGDISSIPSDQIIYRGTDGRMHTYYYTDNDWVHDWLEASWQAPSIHNIGGSVAGAYNGQIFYRGFDGKCRIYFWEPGFLRAPNDYFSMKETPFSPTIPGIDYSNDVLDFTLMPNPVSDELEIEVSAQNSSVVKIRIVNLMGRVVSAHDEMLRGGTNSVKVHTDQLSPGLYFLSIVDSKGLRINKPFVKI